MQITVSDLRIDGVAMPPPLEDGVIIEKPKIWAANTRRVANGDMVGDLLKIKHKLQINWPPLTPEQCAIIDDAVSKAFPEVVFTDQSGVTRSITCYAGTPSYTWHSWRQGMQNLKSVSVSLIEK